MRGGNSCSPGACVLFSLPPGQSSLGKKNEKRFPSSSRAQQLSAPRPVLLSPAQVHIPTTPSSPAPASLTAFRIS